MLVWWDCFVYWKLGQMPFLTRLKYLSLPWKEITILSYVYPSSHPVHNFAVVCNREFLKIEKFSIKIAFFAFINCASLVFVWWACFVHKTLFCWVSVMLSVIMLNVVRLSVIIQSVVVPNLVHFKSILTGSKLCARSTQWTNLNVNGEIALGNVVPFSDEELLEAVRLGLYGSGANVTKLFTSIIYEFL